jgi:hypothetical protein
MLSCARGQAILLRELDGTLRARLRTLATEQATAKIEPQTMLIAGDRIRRTRLGAGLAASGALGLIQHRQAAKAIGEHRRAARECDGPMPLLQTSEQYLQHGGSLARVRPQPSDTLSF